MRLELEIVSKEDCRMLCKLLDLKVINNLKVIQQKLYHVSVPKEEVLEEYLEPNNQG